MLKCTNYTWNEVRVTSPSLSFLSSLYFLSHLTCIHFIRDFYSQFANVVLYLVSRKYFILRSILLRWHHLRSCSGEDMSCQKNKLNVIYLSLSSLDLYKLWFCYSCTNFEHALKWHIQFTFQDS